MSPIERLIRRIIAQDGAVSVGRYMALALYHPEHGYYRHRRAIGAAGDFVTAPEVSQMFGELLGLWCADLWTRMGRPDLVRLVELGPGRGTLIEDALRAIDRAVPELAAARHLHLVEVNTTLRTAQARRLQSFAPEWHETLAAVPDGPLLLVANEFFDALPIRQFARHEDKLLERVVVEAQDGGLAFALAPPVDPAGRALAASLEAQPSLPGDGLIEVSPEREALAGEIGHRIAADGGGALIVDYGAARLDGADTLQAVRGHGRHDVLTDPGTADLTAHVDFGALKRAAEGGGAAVFGPVEQGVFLERLGIDARLDRLADGAPASQREALHAARQRLVSPDAMGSLFKALAIVHPDLGPATGFDA